MEQPAIGTRVRLIRKDWPVLPGDTGSVVEHTNFGGFRVLWERTGRKYGYGTGEADEYLVVEEELPAPIDWSELELQ